MYLGQSGIHFRNKRTEIKESISLSDIGAEQIEVFIVKHIVSEHPFADKLTNILPGPRMNALCDCLELSFIMNKGNKC